MGEETAQHSEWAELYVASLFSNYPLVKAGCAGSLCAFVYVHEWWRTNEPASVSVHACVLFCVCTQVTMY